MAFIGLPFTRPRSAARDLLILPPNRRSFARARYAQYVHRITPPTRVLLAATAVGIVLSIAGCSSSPAPAPVETATPQATSIPVPDIGHSPAPTPLTDAETEAQRISEQDQAWVQVLTRFPQAVRPAVDAVEYVAIDETIEKLIECYESVGVPIDIGRDRHGNIGGVSTLSTTEAEAVAEFVCRQQLRPRPRAPINQAQLGWMYDYLTEFYVPCLEANGIKNPAPPSRSDFIANYPNQNWFPSMGSAFMDNDLGEAIALACPPPK